MAHNLKPGCSLASMIAASFLTAVFGIIQTFWIPGLLSIDNYGYWRAFLLYIGYAGFGHLGLVDGALLLWSNGPSESRPDWRVLRRTMSFFLISNLLVVAVGLSFALTRNYRLAEPVLFALIIYVLLFNLVGITQVYLQVHHRFRLLAFSTVLPGILFTFALPYLALKHASLTILLGFYLAAWALTLLLMLMIVFQTDDQAIECAHEPAPSEAAVGAKIWQHGISYIVAGWPIMLANTGFGIMQSADRVAINMTRPIHDFAIYSLSQSTIYVPISILAASSRVAFSWFAKLSNAHRFALYRSSTRMLTLLWMLLLPYYFLVEHVVRRFLPRYAQGLPAGRILLFSVLFLSLIQIVQANTYSLEGRQRQFFCVSLFAVGLAFATAWIGSTRLGTLTAVAWSQVISAMLWWLCNEFFLSKSAGTRPQDALQTLFCFAASTLLLLRVESLHLNFAAATAVYTGPTLVLSLFLFGDEWRPLRTRWAAIGSNRA